MNEPLQRLNEHAIMEWSCILNCPMSDGAAIQMNVDGDADPDTVGFEYREAPDSDWHYVCQTDDYDTLLEWLEQVTALVKKTKIQYERRRDNPQ